MSNVLIGIIGVILFIGLALAGALFLGPRFQEATSNSKASATMQAISQTADAAVLASLQTGERTQSSSDGKIGRDLVAAGYLKSAPVNPTFPAWAIDAVSENGTYVGDARYMAAGMPISDETTKVCTAIARQSGMRLEDDGRPLAQSTPPASASGCWHSLGWSGSDMYIVYKRI